jgi:hypothetical protein
LQIRHRRFDSDQRLFLPDAAFCGITSPCDSCCESRAAAIADLAAADVCAEDDSEKVRYCFEAKERKIIVETNRG